MRYVKTFDEFMREGGIFVESSPISVWQVIRHAPGETESFACTINSTSGRVVASVRVKRE